MASLDKPNDARLVALIQRVRCPVSHQPLVVADATVIEALNARVRAGELVTQGGEAVTSPLEAGVVRQDGRIFYPVQDGVLRLVAERGIALSVS